MEMTGNKREVQKHFSNTQEEIQEQSPAGAKPRKGHWR